MLDTLTLDAFRPHVGQPFAVLVDDERFMPAHLVNVQALANDGDTRRQRTPFSVVFRGPAGGHLPQGLYRVQSEVMEPMELFLVPLGPGEDGTLYEAVFT